MSTYLTAIVAGPYAFVESQNKSFPPMKVYLRKSVLP
jgi:aminopeptidase N